ncbi:MAG: substrate-binding domain-containing protein [Myxococcota bacterium]
MLCFDAGAETTIRLASTTSTENSGLFSELLPVFEARTGIRVHVVAVGTGQALRMGRAGDADVLLVHDRAAEERFVAEGFGVARREVMFNDFVLLGPRNDPAAIGDLPGQPNQPDVAAALARIASHEAVFVSRADDSGTHKAELRLWRAAGVDPLMASGRWYRETGSGMGATLNTASALGAYTLADRGTWLAFRNPGELAILVEGDESLRNPYGVILVNPDRHPHVQHAAGQAFIDWLLSDAGQDAIGSFRVDGQVLFHPVRTIGAAGESR